MTATPIVNTPNPIHKSNQTVAVDPTKTPQLATSATEKWEHAPWPPVIESPAVVRDAFAEWSLYQ